MTSARDCAQLSGFMQFDVAFIESPFLRIGDIGELFNFRGYIGERLILVRREGTFAIDTN
jgi:hypothetical protein